MLPTAVIAHRLPGRVRIRIESRRRDAAYFAHLDQQLRQCPSVLDVAVTPITGGLLILHDGTDPDVIIEYARTFELFELAVDVPAARDTEQPPAEVIRVGLDGVDQWVQRETAGRTDLRSLGLVALLGAAVWQMARGYVLPAGATLLWYALITTRQHTMDMEGTQRPDATRLKERV